MKERPILFSAPMVRAILDGSKTQTRRVVKKWTGKVDGKAIPSDVSYLPDFTCYRANCPYGQPGDRLWVRETWFSADILFQGYECDPPQTVGYRADLTARIDGVNPIDTYGWNWGHESVKWKPSIHMPRWSSRITLEITGVRVERLQAISHDDALAEGVTDLASTLSEEPYPSGESPEQISHRLQWPQRQFRQLWESISGPGSWDANPWVWVIEFKRVDGAKRA
ncbi:ASCH domain-containing protein [Pandoraea sputorum]|uniref:hypothetical protein n=1 Tax=Pandoraea sputorum TaxID=93222 RepID=UPI001258B726|nr:hypothetical protein [Pandoraea sputorum]VVE07452.1 hypothetical protein PSP20601_02470 [Pandoraea sputorum]